MEQAPSRSHGASPHCGLDVGCKHCSSRMKLRGLDVRAQARRINIGYIGAIHCCKAPLWGWRLDLQICRCSDLNTAICAPSTDVTRRREEEVAGRSLRTGSTHGVVRGPSDGRGWGLRVAFKALFPDEAAPKAHFPFPIFWRPGPTITGPIVI